MELSRVKDSPNMFGGSFRRCQEHFLVVSRNIEGCFKSVFRMFQENFKGVSTKFQGRFKRGLSKFQEYYMEISMVVHKCYRGVSKKIHIF